MNNLASTYEVKGEHENAITFYKKAVAIAPNFEEAWLNICAVYFNLGQIDSAYQALTHIDTNTKNPKYNKFVSVVLQAKFNAVALTEPALQICTGKIVQYMDMVRVDSISCFKILTCPIRIVLVKVCTPPVPIKGG